MYPLSVLKEAFDEYVDELMPGGMTGDLEWSERPGLGVVLEQLKDCTDIMQSETCHDLDLPLGSTYAQGAQALKPRVRRKD